MPDIVAIKDKSAASYLVQSFFNGMGKGRFPGTGQPCEPEIHSFVVVHNFSPTAGDSGMVPDDIVLLFGHVWTCFLFMVKQSG
jgi:hypothetical protein